MIIKLTRNEALELCSIKSDIRPCRIADKLRSIGYSEIKTIGRGEKIIFECKIGDDSERESYYNFKNICIKQYGYNACFEYHTVLDIVELFIKEKELNTKKKITNKSIIEKVGISRVTFSKHRRHLTGNIFNVYHLEKHKPRIDILAHKSCFNVYRMKDKQGKIIYVGKTINMKNRMNGYFSGIDKEDWHTKVREIEYISLKTHSDMSIYELYYIAKYKPKYNKVNKRDICTIKIEELCWKPYKKINKQRIRKQRIEHGSDFKIYYEITEELKYDKELLEVINKAISFKNKLTNNK